MKLHNRGTPLSPCAKNNQGFVLIIVVLLMSAVMTTVFIQTALNSLIILEQSQKALDGARAKMYAEGCMQEALLRLSRDSTYTGGNLMLNSGTCDVVISGLGTARVVTVRGTLGVYTQPLVVSVELNPLTITSWDN